ncbi:hypothetical protein EDB89DRAFT_1902706 [Lactarius sanguifluus]|nr:hypothetical protein EDB89DRAFT_1902706 [Lactarius sanguifluus]
MRWSCSHTFASIIKELDNDLTRMICHLVPIEDDISILDDAQQPLCSFHEKSVTLNWHTVLSLGFHTSIHLPQDGQLHSSCHVTFLLDVSIQLGFGTSLLSVRVGSLQYPVGNSEGGTQGVADVGKAKDDEGEVGYDEGEVGGVHDL